MNDGQTLRYPQLDGLRFVGFLAVFFYHADIQRFWMAWPIVMIFFSLSGWLITGVLQRALERHQNYKQVLVEYYLRRFLRIFPVYFLVIAATALTIGSPYLRSQLTFSFNFYLFLKTADRMSQMSYFAFLKGHWRDIGTHFWTLCVEEQFYLLFPLPFVFARSSFRIWISVFLALSIGSRLWFMHSNPYSYYGVLPWIAGEYIAFGCIAAVVFKEVRLTRKQATFLTYFSITSAVILAGMSCYFRLSSELEQLAPRSVQTPLAILFASFVMGLQAEPKTWVAHFLGYSPVAWLGRRTYSMYLIHLYLWPWSEKYLGSPQTNHLGPDTFVKLVLSIMGAVFFWYCVERPAQTFFLPKINRLRESIK